ncbi:hypothetical protein MANES_17G022050v8 [Manihot esculenta]|uniref:Uncharacterized protein n=1 Tax=Manihot esculenta TaxID=3983 RepID=A0ACB7G2E6_MANES|nr:hypothetical protein MANES_17G022050v8 [Manihot esculenta]
MMTLIFVFHLLPIVSNCRACPPQTQIKWKYVSQRLAISCCIFKHDKLYVMTKKENKRGCDCMWN